MALKPLKKRKFKKRAGFNVYIAQCADGTYYTGLTNNLEKRIALHNNGKGAKSLRGKLPVKLVYSKKYKYYKNVFLAEKNIKRLTRKQKEKLVESSDYIRK